MVQTQEVSVAGKHAEGRSSTLSVLVEQFRPINSNLPLTCCLCLVLGVSGHLQVPPVPGGGAPHAHGAGAQPHCVPHEGVGTRCHPCQEQVLSMLTCSSLLPMLNASLSTGLYQVLPEEAAPCEEGQRPNRVRERGGQWQPWLWVFATGCSTCVGRCGPQQHVDSELEEHEAIVGAKDRSTNQESRVFLGQPTATRAEMCLILVPASAATTTPCCSRFTSLQLAFSCGRRAAQMERVPHLAGT
eukprot:1137409-Pelagomonas_calceolata.AAC.1